MITFNFKTSVALAILGFVLGCCTMWLLSSRCNNNTQKQSLVKAKELKKAADTKQAVYQVKIAELEKINRQLHTDLSATKAKLETAKQKTGQRSSAIKRMIEPKGYLAKDLLKKVAASSTAIDSSLSPCDSLTHEIDSFLHETETKDSLYENQLRMQDSLIAVKDTVIGLMTELHNEQLRLFDQCLDEQQKLATLNKSLQKQHKRQRLRSKLAALGTAILSGITINYLIWH